MHFNDEIVESVRIIKQLLMVKFALSLQKHLGQFNVLKQLRIEFIYI
jgi:hypothetical protein